MQKNKNNQSFPFSGCGIAGAVNLRAPLIGRKVVEAMTSSLSHRGPSGHGIWEHPAGIFFGHHRLSIQDLSERGRQPMERGPLCITYNGEVYNFHDLRRELEQAGYTFSSGTDTEVILRAYERWGLACFERFNGMFALAIWDDRTRELILARDRMGIKPLYYNLTDDYLVFASEVQALLKSGIIDNEIDYQTIFRQYNVGSFLGYEEGRTCVKNVMEFPPAHWAVVSLTGEMRLKRYWQLPCEKGPIVSERRLAGELRALFCDSVRLRLVSDVPVAAFLSGGLDSSSIVAFAASLQKAHRLQTFTTWYTEGYAATNLGKEENDLKYARLLAGRLAKRIEHDVVEVSIRELSLENIDCVIDLARIPDQIREIALYHNYRVVNDAGVKVVLNGQGSDELMAGYTGCGEIADYFLFSSSPDTVLMEKFFPSLLLSRKESLNPQVFENGSKISTEIMRHVYSFEGELPEKVHRFLMQTQLRQILRFEDYLSMHFGIECRLPFLDYRLAEWVFRQPFGLNIDKRTRTGKLLFRKAMNGVLPQVIVRRPKARFPFGDYESTKQRLFKLFREFRQEINRSDVVKRVYAQDFLNKELPEDISLQELWMLLSLWRCEEVLKKASTKKENAPLRSESRMLRLQNENEPAMTMNKNKALIIWPPAVDSSVLPLETAQLVAFWKKHNVKDFEVFDMNSAYSKGAGNARFLYTLLNSACSVFEKNISKAADYKNPLYDYLCKKKNQIAGFGELNIREKIRRLLTDKVNSLQAPLVCVSVESSEQLFYSIMIARELKQMFGSKAVIVLGGAQVAVQLDHLKKSTEIYTFVDFLAVGDGAAESGIPAFQIRPGGI